MSVYEFGPFQLNAMRLTLHAGGRSVALGRRVLSTLVALVENAGAVMEKERLLERVWPEGFVEEANLTQNVYVLRKTLAEHGMRDAIETVPRRGYRFTAPVRIAVEASSPVPRRGLAAALAGLAFVAASFALVASSGHTSTAQDTLSERGARLYQIGLYYWNLRTREGVAKSFNYFTQVVESDPLSPLGYAALADANLTMGDYCYGTHRPPVYFARAREYARKALALDPNSAEAYAALGFVALRNNDVADGMAALRRAIALDASYGPAHEWYGIALLKQGKRPQGLRELETAANLNPLSVAASAWLGSAALQNRRFGDAITYSRQALELSPQRADALVIIGKSYQAQGNYAAASGALQQARAQFRFARAHVGRNHRSAFENAARPE